MSLILEALRKSEAERQRGRAPGLFVEQVPASRRQRSAPAWAWGLGVLLLAVLAVFAWREWGRSAAPEQASGPAPDANVQAPVPASGPMPPAPATATTLPAVAPAPSAAPPPLATTPSVAAPLPATSPAPATVAAAVAAPVAAPAPAPDPARAPAAASAPAAAPALAPTPAFAESAEPELPTLSNIDANERAQLPPLRLSMHVYAEEPGQRFVILDGQRLGEGASPAPGVVLEQIRRDGLVLSVNGRRVLLPRP